MDFLGSLKKLLGQDSPQPQPQQQMPVSRYEDGSIQRGNVSISPGMQNRQINQQPPRQQRPMSVGNAYGNPGMGQRTVSPALGSGTRIPNYLQPSRQRMYEDELTGLNELQPVDYNTQQGTLNSDFLQSSGPYMDRFKKIF